MLNGFILNKKWIFNNNKKNTKNEKIKFFSTYITTYFLGILLIYIFVDVMHISKIIAPYLVIFINTPINYLISKFWVFNIKQNTIFEKDKV